MRSYHLAVVVCVLAIGSPAIAQDTIPNPEFTNWSKFKKGTSVTMKSTTVAAGMTTEASFTTTLVEVGTEKLVLESSSVVKAAGMEFKSDGEKRDVPKSFVLPKGTKKEETPAAKKPEEGAETLKIAGVEMKTKWYKFKMEVGGTTTESQTWMAEDFPGMMVKTVSKTSGKITSTSTMEVIEFKKP